jgi:CHAD domain-containing protein
MTSDVEGIAWTFDAVDLRPVLRWLERPERRAGAEAVEVVATRTITTQVDRYFETADVRFQRAGYALRIRRIGRRREAEATLKGLDAAPVDAPGSCNRLEVIERLRAADLETLLGAAGPVGQRVRAVVGTKTLLPMFEVRTRRRTFLLKLDGVPPAEVALDETAIRPQTGGPPTRLRRVEIELARSALPALEPLVRELRDACALQPAGLGAFAVGLLSSDVRPLALDRFGASDVDPGMTSRAVALTVLRRHFSALLAREPGTRLGDDIEELHEMRVASRRLRAALSLFVEVLPETALRARDELRWIGERLGAVRDIDVLAEQLDSWLDTVEGADRDALAMLRSLLHEQRQVARVAMLEMLDSRRYEAFVSRFGRTLSARHEARSGPASQAARALAPELIERHYRSVRKAGDSIRLASPATEYHRLRIRCKRLRYALEFLGPLYPGETRPLVKRLVVVQDVLGMHQDADVAIDRLRRLSLSHGRVLDPGTVFAMGEIAERQRRSMIEQRARFPAAFAGMSSKRWNAFRKRLENEHPAPARRPATPDDREPRTG